METSGDRIAVGDSIRHDRENVGHRSVTATLFTRGDIASGLVSEKICDLQRNGALLIRKVQPAHEGRERRMCLVDFEYAPKVILVGTTTFDNE